MKWTFSDVYTKVSEYLGLGSTPTGNNLTKVKDIVYRAYMQFLMPLDIRDSRNKSIYVWSFLHKTASLTTKCGVNQVQLPLDFDNFQVGLKYGPVERRNIIEVSLKHLRESQGWTDSTSYPFEYAVVQGMYSPSTGQNKLVEFYPVPNGAIELRYVYAFIPEKPVNATDVFVGDALISECILQMALAEAESGEDETMGVQKQKAVIILETTMKRDMPIVPATLGIVSDGVTMHGDPWLIREDRDRTVYGNQIDRE
jgi:hypothetical protein